MLLVVVENNLTADCGRWPRSGFGSQQQPIQEILGIVADGWIRAFAPMAERTCVLRMESFVHGQPLFLGEKTRRSHEAVQKFVRADRRLLVGAKEVSTFGAFHIF